MSIKPIIKPLLYRLRVVNVPMLAHNVEALAMAGAFVNVPPEPLLIENIMLKIRSKAY